MKPVRGCRSCGSARRRELLEVSRTPARAETRAEAATRSDVTSPVTSQGDEVTHGQDDKGFVRITRWADRIDPPGREVDHEHRVIRHQPSHRPHPVVKNSPATSAGQCARRNVRQVVGRSRLGGMPSAFRMPASSIVRHDGPRSSAHLGYACNPSPDSRSPSGRPVAESRRAPQVGLIAAGRRSISAQSGSRCHLRIVSGERSVATCRRTPRPSRCPSTARRRRS
jgi:hypothetical protein